MLDELWVGESVHYAYGFLIYIDGDLVQLKNPTDSCPAIYRLMLLLQERKSKTFCYYLSV